MLSVAAGCFDTIAVLVATVTVHVPDHAIWPVATRAFTSSRCLVGRGNTSRQLQHREIPAALRILDCTCMVTMEAHAHALVAGHRVRAAAVVDQGRLNERLGLGVDLLWHRLRGHLQQQQHCTALDLVRRSRSHHPMSRVAWQPGRCDQKVAPARAVRV